MTRLGSDAKSKFDQDEEFTSIKYVIEDQNVYVRDNIITTDHLDEVPTQLHASYIKQELLRDGSLLRGMVIDYTIEILRRNACDGIYIAKSYVAT